MGRRPGRCRLGGRADRRARRPGAPLRHALRPGARHRGVRGLSGHPPRRRGGLPARGRRSACRARWLREPCLAGRRVSRRSAGGGLLPGCAHPPGLRGVGLLPQRPRGRPRAAARVLRRRVRPARSRPVRAHAGAALHRAAPGAARAGRRVLAAGRAARAGGGRCARPAHRGRGSPPPRGRGAGRPHRARRQRHRGHPHRARGAARRPHPRGRPGGLGLHASHGGACGGLARHRGPERRGDVLPRRGPLPGRARPRPRAGPARPRRGGGRAHGRRGRGCRARRLHGRRRDGVPGVRLVRGARAVLPRPASGAPEGRR